jgi:hypothetical protein
MIEKHVAILSIDRLYKISGNQLHGFMKKYPNVNHGFKRLPALTYSTNDGGKHKLRYAEDYLYYVAYENNEKEYLFFDLSTTDGLLNEEISNSGIEDLFEGVNWKNILSVFEPESFDRLNKGYFPKAKYLIAELKYEMSKDWEYGWECDGVYGDIIGYLDEDLDKHYFVKEECKV